MSSDYEYSDEDFDDDDFMDSQEDGWSFISYSYRFIIYIKSLESDGEMDIDASRDDFKIASKDKPKPYEIDYQSLTQSDVEKLIQEDIDHITGIFGVEVS